MSVNTSEGRRVVMFGPADPGVTGGVASVMAGVVRTARSIPGLVVETVDSGTGRQEGKRAAFLERLRGMRRLRKSGERGGILHAQMCESTVLWDGLSVLVGGRGFDAIVAHVHCKPDALERAGLLQKIGWGLLRRRCARLAVIAPGIDRQFRREWGSRVVVLPNFVDEELIRQTADGQKDKIVLFLGRMTTDKGIFVLLDCADRVRAAGWRLVFAGPFADPREEEQFQQRSQAMDGVSWLGRVTGPAKIEILRQASVFALPSWHKGEIFPVALLEAGAAGACVVASKVGVIEEILGGGKFGVLLPSVEKNVVGRVLEKVMSDGAGRKALGESFQEVVRNRYSEGAVIGALRELYWSLT